MKLQPSPNVAQQTSRSPPVIFDKHNIQSGKLSMSTSAFPKYRGKSGECSTVFTSVFCDGEENENQPGGVGNQECVVGYAVIAIWGKAFNQVPDVALSERCSLQQEIVAKSFKVATNSTKSCLSSCSFRLSAVGMTMITVDSAGK